jgi:hypothetical protein
MIFRVFFINNEDYPNANEVSLAISVEKMPQSLLKFICWLIDEKAYKAASEPYIVPIDKIRKILGITESIVSLSKHTFIPFHLGLAVQLHHEFGSHGLVDNLNSHGFCASYSEVRRFLTSVALKEEDRIKEGVYVPDDIVPVCQGGCLIQEGTDKSETIDSVNPRIFLIVSIDTVYGSDAALYAFSSINQQINLRSD